MLFNKKKSDKSFVDLPLKLMTANPSEIANEAKVATDFSYTEAFKDSKIFDIKVTNPIYAKIVGSLASSAENNLDSEDNRGACSYPELKSSMQKDVYADFSDSVEPDSKLWKNSNLKKIVKTIEMFGSFNEFQKFYLSISLNTYLNSTMHNGGGSIVDIKYDSRDDAFKIRTVDTFNYKYSKNANYCTSMRYREVTMDMLLSQYALPKSSLDDESAFRNVLNKIKIEPQGKDVAYKLIFMALASESGIGTVRNDMEGIYLANGHGEKEVSVWLGEIRQDVRTSGILEAGREVLEWSIAAQDALHKTIEQDSEMKPKTKRSLADALISDGMTEPVYFFLHGVSMRVSEAYSRFEPLNDSEFSSLAKDFIMEASALEKSLRQTRALLPDGPYKVFDINSILMSDKRYVSGPRYAMNVETLIDACIKVLEAKKAQMEEDLSKNVYINADADLLRR